MGEAKKALRIGGDLVCEGGQELGDRADEEQGGQQALGKDPQFHSPF